MSRLRTVSKELLQKLGLQVRENLTEVEKVTEQVLAGDLTSKQRRFLSAVKTRAHQQVEMANQIMELAKVEVEKKLRVES